MSIEERVKRKFIVSLCGKHAVNLDAESSHHNWIFKREQNHDAWPWYSLRPATPQEINSAERQLMMLNFAASLPIYNPNRSTYEQCNGSRACNMDKWSIWRKFNDRAGDAWIFRI